MKEKYYIKEKTNLATEKKIVLHLSLKIKKRPPILDKNPGLRPIGISEILRRIVGKVVVSTIRGGVTESVGSLQACAGQEAGSEAAVRLIHEIFKE